MNPLRSTPTPGPWSFHAKLTASENHKGYRLADKDGAWLGDLSPCDEDGKEGGANARLIAAAPELLEALRKYLDATDAEVSGLEVNWRPVILKARAAIVKATGEA